MLDKKIIELVVAARLIAYNDHNIDYSDWKRLDKALEAFNEIPWDDEPETSKHDSPRQAAAIGEEYIPYGEKKNK